MATIKAEYNKQRKSLLQKINRAKKRGYIFSDDIIPSIPKKPTKASISRLKKLSKDLYKHARYVDVETGELLTGQAGRQFEKRKSAYKAKQTRKNKKDFWTTDITPIPQKYERQNEEYARFSDTVIAEYRRQINMFPAKVASIVLSALDRAIEKSGKTVVAMRLESSAESLSNYLNNVGLFGDSIAAILAYCSAMFGDLPGMNEDDIKSANDYMDAESYEG